MVHNTYCHPLLASLTCMLTSWHIPVLLQRREAHVKGINIIPNLANSNKVSVVAHQ